MNQLHEILGVSWLSSLQDLNGYDEPTEDSRGMRQRQLAFRAMPSAVEVRHLADYKNVAFLEKFISPSGRLLSRR